MSAESKHIIQRQIFQLHLDKEEHHHELTEEIKRVFNTQIIPQLSKTFDDISQGRTIRINKLEVELPRMNLGNWKEKFTKLLVQEIRREIELQLPEIMVTEKRQQLVEGDIPSQNKTKTGSNTSEAFLFFCQKGYFPWWFKTRTFATFEAEVLKMKTNVLEYNIHRIIAKPNHLERLVQQFSDDFFKTYFKQQKQQIVSLERTVWENVLLQTKSIILNEAKAKKVVLKSILSAQWITHTTGNEQKEIEKIFIEEIIQFVQAETKQSKTDIALQLFKVLKEEKKVETENTVKVIKEFIEQESGRIKFENDFMVSDNQKNATDKSIHTIGTSGKRREEEIGDDEDLSKDIHYIKNAGVVIIWPFLGRFFENLGLTNGTSFKNDESQIKAIHILQYLADGETHWNENELLINKIICGFPVWQTIPTDLKLTTKIKEESEALFNSIIEYWSKLKNTSAAGVQSGFIQREGKLEKLEKHWKLTIPRETLDVLLDHIPWSFKMVKSPWMKETIRVHW